MDMARFEIAYVSSFTGGECMYGSYFSFGALLVACIRIFDNTLVCSGKYIAGSRIKIFRHRAQICASLSRSIIISVIEVFPNVQDANTAQLTTSRAANQFRNNEASKLVSFR
jgi:hypothetical protein